MRPTAALYVETDGCYFGLPGVDPWDEPRDARRYAGPHPVVAHPPCQRWGKMWFGQPLAVKRTGVRKLKGDDDGCFDRALWAVRTFGGVLEHPWDSNAWPWFGLTVPPREGGWVKADSFGGWTCCVEQGRYGHYARKPTLLYAVGVDLPELEWGAGEPSFPEWAIEKYGLAKCKRAGELAFKGGGTDSSPRIGTPEPFRDLLLSIARTALPLHRSPRSYRWRAAGGFCFPCSCCRGNAMSVRQSTATRPVFSASAVLAAVASELSTIKHEDGLTDADLGRVLGKSEDQAAKYRSGLAEMGVVAYAAAKREWNGRFTGALDRLCVESRPAPVDDRRAQCTILEAALALSVALADGNVSPEEVRANRPTLEAALEAIQAQLSKLGPGVAA